MDMIIDHMRISKIPTDQGCKFYSNYSRKFLNAKPRLRIKVTKIVNIPRQKNQLQKSSQILVYILFKYLHF